MQFYINIYVNIYNLYILININVRNAQNTTSNIVKIYRITIIYLNKFKYYGNIGLNQI